MATTRKKAVTKKATAKKTGTKKSEPAAKPRASSTTAKPRSSAAAKPRASSTTTAKPRAGTAAKPRAGKSAAPSSTAKSAAKGAAKSAVKPVPAAGRAKPVREKPKASEDSAAQRVALAVAAAALDKKAVNVEIIDVTGKVDYADYVVVMSGTSDRQVSALARGISEDVQENTGSRCLGVEGLPGGAWVLMDFGDVVVHIFHHDVRGYYDLESLWLDAARLPVPGSAAR